MFLQNPGRRSCGQWLDADFAGGHRLYGGSEHEDPRELRELRGEVVDFPVKVGRKSPVHHYYPASITEIN